jgi:hypothetical protein
MDDGPPVVDEPLGMQRPSAEDLRVVTYNVHFDSPWDAGQGVRFGRQLAAVAPDILNFQEIYDHSVQQTVAFVGDWVPPNQGGSWHGAGNGDCITVSRYPVVGSWPLDGNVAVLLDATSKLGTQILVVNAHLPCCADEEGRQREIDRILSFLRDAKTPGGLLELAEETPFLIAGDLNLVGYAATLQSLLTGDVSDEGTYGPDFPPDWDGSDLGSVFWRQTELRMGYSWRDDGGSFWPGHLDYLIHTDSVLALTGRFVLYTPEMSPESLAAHGLQPTDSQASDHLLGCADFRPDGPGDVADIPTGIRRPDLHMFPNPLVGKGWLSLEMVAAGDVRLEVFDASGRRVAQPAGSGWVSLSKGTWNLRWEARDGAGAALAGGTYFVRARVKEPRGRTEADGKWLVLR